MATKKTAVAPKKESPQKALPNILMRIVAVFAASGLSVLGAGAAINAAAVATGGATGGGTGGGGNSGGGGASGANSPGSRGGRKW